MKNLLEPKFVVPGEGKWVSLQHSVVQRRSFGATAWFTDGSHVNSVAAFGDPHYHVVAHRCGYGDDLLRYCFEHEFAHLFLWEKLMRAPSRVLWSLANDRPITAGEAAVEEIAAMAFQRWLRASEEPIVGGVDWGQLKAEALELLGG